MNIDSISSACLMIYDALINDKQSKSLLKKIDSAKTDEQVKAGIVAGVKRLNELGQHTIARDIEAKTKGFAF